MVQNQFQVIVDGVGFCKVDTHEEAIGALKRRGWTLAPQAQDFFLKEEDGEIHNAIIVRVYPSLG